MRANAPVLPFRTPVRLQRRRQAPEMDGGDTVKNWHKLAIGFGLVLVSLIIINNVSFLKGLASIQLFGGATAKKAA
jgi:hypothetical protein